MKKNTMYLSVNEALRMSAHKDFVQGRLSRGGLNKMIQLFPIAADRSPLAYEILLNQHAR